MIINPFMFAGGGPSPDDPYFAFVVALLHFDGANGGTSFPDVKGNVWTPRNSAQTTTAQKKFGTASGDFTSSANNAITTPDATALQMGTDPFTIEGWFKPNAPGVGFGMCYQKGVNSSGGITLGVTPTAVAMRVNGTSDTNVTGLDLTDWTHVVWQRDGSNAVSIYVGGTRMFNGTVTFDQSDTSYLQIGANDYLIGNSNFSYRGYMDEFRVTKGVARYSGATIAVPTAPFPDA